MSNHETLRWTLSLLASLYMQREARRLEAARATFAKVFPDDAIALVIDVEATS